MSVKTVVPGLHQISLGKVNAFLLEFERGLVLFDTGVEGSAGTILKAVHELGRRPIDVRQILATHCHSDHAGSLAALRTLTGARVGMHATDAALVRRGECLRPLHAAPGLFNAIASKILLRMAPTRIEPSEVDHEIADGEVIPIAGGVRAIHVPGHCAGQLAFLIPIAGGVLIAADAAANVFGLGLSPFYEDVELGRRSLEKLAALDFEAACFGHGSPIVSGAAAQFRRKWGRAAA